MRLDVKLGAQQNEAAEAGPVRAAAVALAEHLLDAHAQRAHVTEGGLGRQQLCNAGGGGRAALHQRVAAHHLRRHRLQRLPRAAVRRGLQQLRECGAIARNLQLPVGGLAEQVAVHAQAVQAEHQAPVEHAVLLLGCEATGVSPRSETRARTGELLPCQARTGAHLARRVARVEHARQVAHSPVAVVHKDQHVSAVKPPWHDTQGDAAGASSERILQHLDQRVQRGAVHRGVQISGP